MRSGVYTITNLVNNKIYVGSTLDFNRRKREHFSELCRGKHSNKHLQNAYNKYGKDNLVFEILEHCDVNLLESIEQYWLNMLDCCNKLKGYNLLPTTYSTRGYKFPEGSRTGEKNNFFGRKHSAESLRKMSESKKGKFYEKPKRRKPIVQYDKNMNMIAEYKSINETRDKTGISLATLQRNLHGYTKSKSFIFKYKEEIV